MAEAEMEEDLQNYLKMNTYLDSADPWFWPKLRFVADKMGIRNDNNPLQVHIATQEKGFCHRRKGFLVHTE